MFNECLWVGAAVLSFILLLLIYKFFGKSGLLVWIGMATVVANIQVLKQVEMFGITATLGNILYGTIFLATDILNEKYGREEAKKAVWLGFFTLFTTTILMQIALQYIPAESDFAQPALESLFSIVPQIAAGSLIAYIISQNCDVWLYNVIRKRLPNQKYLWIRNNGSTMISQLVDTLIFCSIAFYGTPFNTWLEILFTTYFIKFLVAGIDTPFMYLAVKLHKTKEA
jgi:queuosine precursor transporter